MWCGSAPAWIGWARLQAAAWLPIPWAIAAVVAAAPRPVDDRARLHHWGARVRQRQDDTDAWLAAGTVAAASAHRRLQGGARLYRSGVPCRRHWATEFQHRSLGHAAGDGHAHPATTR